MIQTTERKQNMSKIIAGIYETDCEIGSGGGGIVYLGRHTRLNKQIVLKADRRRLSAGEEKLRKESDLLKGLSHTYIPQVYDFVQEGDTVYTVMDYVEGESLDKVLARGQKIPQKMIVKWACQLLEALNYLHQQKPHGILHGDIKPANIMLRPDGSICLIDFNIALALGEDGAVRVGYSRGYASPEHYGSEGADLNPFSKSLMHGAVPGTGSEKDSGISDTLILNPKEHRGKRSGMSDGSSSSGRKVLLDVRSDIYSLGATLYHLLSGKKPAVRAADVTPLNESCCSLQIAQIIAKSMNPDASRRYQSAEEMLDAFLHLRTNDRRVKKNKRHYIIAAAVSACLLFAGAAGVFIGMKQKENYQESFALAGDSQLLLADGDTKSAVRQAVRALDTGEGIFKVPVPAKAQKALSDARGVYDLSDGFKQEDILTLPAAPFALEVSPKGTRFAAVYAYEAAVYSVGSDTPDVRCHLKESAFSDCLFLDEDTIVYAGQKGVEAYSIPQKKVLWTGDEAACLTLSGDGSTVAALNVRDDYAVLYNAADGKKKAECRFHGRRMLADVNDIYVDWQNYLFALDNTGDWLAVSFTNGGLSVFDTKDEDNELILYDESDYDRFSGGFCGKMFAYAANGSSGNFFGVLDTEEPAMAGSMESRDNVICRADENGICLSDGNLLARFAPGTLEETELAYTQGNTIADYDAGERFTMVVTDDDAVSFYDRAANLVSSIAFENGHDFIRLAGNYALAASREEPKVRILQLEEHEEAQLACYDAGYAHDEARVSADGASVMLFDYKGFRTYGCDGTLISECSLPDAEAVYDQQFIRKEGDSYLEVIWYDGTVRRYGMDGTLLAEKDTEEKEESPKERTEEESQIKKEAPDKNLEEEFLTDRYRIVSKLHEPPMVYEKESGKSAGQLEEDAELAYVTQLEGGCIMTEYVSTKLQRYGLLLDEDLQTLAYLPDICDVYGDTVVFDYHNGSIRACSIYSLEELAALGQAAGEVVGKGM